MEDINLTVKRKKRRSLRLTVDNVQNLDESLGTTWLDESPKSIKSSRRKNRRSRIYSEPLRRISDIQENSIELSRSPDKNYEQAESAALDIVSKDCGHLLSETPEQVSKGCKHILSETPEHISKDYGHILSETPEQMSKDLCHVPLITPEFISLKSPNSLKCSNQLIDEKLYKDGKTLFVSTPINLNRNSSFSSPHCKNHVSPSLDQENTPYSPSQVLHGLDLSSSPGTPLSDSVYLTPMSENKYISKTLPTEKLIPSDIKTSAAKQPKSTRKSSAKKIVPKTNVPMTKQQANGFFSICKSLAGKFMNLRKAETSENPDEQKLRVENASPNEICSELDADIDNCPAGKYDGYNSNKEANQMLSGVKSGMGDIYSPKDSFITSKFHTSPGAALKPGSSIKSVDDLHDIHQCHQITDNGKAMTDTNNPSGEHIYHAAATNNAAAVQIPPQDTICVTVDVHKNTEGKETSKSAKIDSMTEKNQHLFKNHVNYIQKNIDIEHDKILSIDENGKEIGYFKKNVKKESRKNTKETQQERNRLLRNMNSVVTKSVDSGNKGSQSSSGQPGDNESTKVKSGLKGTNYIGKKCIVPRRSTRNSPRTSDSNKSDKCYVLNEVSTKSSESSPSDISVKRYKTTGLKGHNPKYLQKRKVVNVSSEFLPCMDSLTKGSNCTKNYDVLPVIDGTCVVPLSVTSQGSVLSQYSGEECGYSECDTDDVFMETNEDKNVTRPDKSVIKQKRKRRPKRLQSRKRSTIKKSLLCLSELTDITTPVIKGKESTDLSAVSGSNHRICQSENNPSRSDENISEVPVSISHFNSLDTGIISHKRGLDHHNVGDITPNSHSSPFHVDDKDKGLNDTTTKYSDPEIISLSNSECQVLCPEVKAINLKMFADLDCGDENQENIVEVTKSKKKRRGRRSLEQKLLEENTALLEGVTKSNEEGNDTGVFNRRSLRSKRRSLELCRSAMKSAAVENVISEEGSKQEIVQGNPDVLNEMDMCYNVGPQLKTYGKRKHVESSSDVEMIYRNKNYKAPSEKKWETIFESPHARNPNLIGKRRLKRALEFDINLVYHVPAVKQKKRLQKAMKHGWNPKQRNNQTLPDHIVMDKLAKMERVLAE